MRYFIELAYHGKAYHGWQKQPNAISVQEVLEKALSTLLREQISIVGAGRTDTGVHASKMTAHFDTMDAFHSKPFIQKLNAFLPKTIAVLDIYKVQPSVHARFDALTRTYHYNITTSKNVFHVDFSYTIYKALDLDTMQKACAIILKHTDFQCFSKTHTDVKTYLCHIKEAYWEKHSNGLIFVITANRFLRNMVRAIVGTMIDIGYGKTSLQDLKHIIASKDRSRAGFSVPAEGLFLVDIVYPHDIRL